MRWPSSPTADLIAGFILLFGLLQLGEIFGVGISLVALATPIARPWTLVTSVYFHSGIGHLIANSVALALIGFLLERRTTRIRFHVFVLISGMIAGLGELLVGNMLGTPPAVIGASGGILALYGYLVAGNPITGSVLNRFDITKRTGLIIAVGAAIVITVLTAGPSVALVAHAVGFFLGALAGHFHLLSVN